MVDEWRGMGVCDGVVAGDVWLGGVEGSVCVCVCGCVCVCVCV